MPYQEYLEIVPSKDIQGIDVGYDEEVEGLEWFVFWNELKLPWAMKTECQAYAIALGCQFGATKMMTKMFDRAK